MIGEFFPVEKCLQTKKNVSFYDQFFHCFAQNIKLKHIIPRIYLDTDKLFIDLI